jgi:hypothetical protein
MVAGFERKWRIFLLKSSWKWLLPLLVMFVITNTGTRQFIFGAKNKYGEFTNAGILSTTFGNKNSNKPEPSAADIATKSPEVQQARDPFQPSNFDAGAKFRKIKNNPLDGIALRQNKHYALIAGRLLAVGDRISNMRVINITDNKVVLAGSGKIRIYFLF